MGHGGIPGNEFESRGNKIVLYQFFAISIKSKMILVQFPIAVVRTIPRDQDFALPLPLTQAGSRTQCAM